MNDSDPLIGQSMLELVSHRIDMVLVSGDIANMPMDIDNTATAEEVAKHHSHLEQVVKEFTTISTRVYYVPGNVSLSISVFPLSTSSPSLKETSFPLPNSLLHKSLLSPASMMQSRHSRPADSPPPTSLAMCT